jgi:hypothetical protein
MYTHNVYENTRLLRTSDGEQNGDVEAHYGVIWLKVKANISGYLGHG